MQEKKEPVFVVATANDIASLPPELLRKGRFDEIFFVDLPTRKERENIFSIHLKRKNRNLNSLKLNLPRLLDLTEGFSGAEIEEVVSESMFLAFDSNKKDIEKNDVEICINQTSPLSKTMSETISNLRKWAKERARFASSEVAPAMIQKVNEEVPVLIQESSNPFIKRSK
jgi:SpoVK/Ycf46/Vps4 family AAA+-type ATPase